MSTPRHFRFRLARVKRVREIEEQVARASWSAAERTAAESEVRCDEVREQVADARSASCVMGSLDPSILVLNQRATDGLLLGLLRSKEAALTLRGQATRLGDAWRNREVDRRALEKLEGRARERHRVEVERVEARELDETGILRSLAKRKEPRESSSSRAPRATDDSAGPR